MNKILTYLSPYMLWIKIAFCVTLAVGGFYLGMKTQQTFDDAANTTQYENIIISMGKNQEKDKQLITELQEKQAGLNETYIKLNKELKNAKGLLASCKGGGNVVITDNGVRLWDNLNQGLGVSEDSTGASETTTVPRAAVTLEDIYDNHSANSEICNGLRDQILSIIEWDNKTFPAKEK